MSTFPPRHDNTSCVGDTQERGPIRHHYHRLRDTLGPRNIRRRHHAYESPNMHETDKLMSVHLEYRSEKKCCFFLFLPSPRFVHGSSYVGDCDYPLMTTKEATHVSFLWKATFSQCPAAEEWCCGPFSIRSMNYIQFI